MNSKYSICQRTSEYFKAFYITYKTVILNKMLSNILLDFKLGGDTMSLYLGRIY